MPRTWDIVREANKEFGAACPLTVIVELATWGMSDKFLPFSLTSGWVKDKLLPGTLQALVQAQEIVLAVTFIRGEHKVLAPSQSVPFKGVLARSAHGSFGRVNKVVDRTTDACIPSKSAHQSYARNKT